MVQGMLPGVSPMVARESDVVMTPRDVARGIVEHFKPSGRVLDPARGDGAFYDCMEGAEWCEVREGRDFFGWTEPVDWIVTNPPFSVFSDFLRHAFTLAEHVVFLTAANRPFNSTRLMRETMAWGGIREMLITGSGSEMGFPIGYCCAAIHYERGYRGPMALSWLELG